MSRYIIIQESKVYTVLPVGFVVIYLSMTFLLYNFDVTFLFFGTEISTNEDNCIQTILLPFVLIWKYLDVSHIFFVRHSKQNMANRIKRIPCK